MAQRTVLCPERSRSQLHIWANVTGCALVSCRTLYVPRLYRTRNSHQYYFLQSVQSREQVTTATSVQHQETSTKEALRTTASTSMGHSSSPWHRTPHKKPHEAALLSLFNVKNTPSCGNPPAWDTSALWGGINIDVFEDLFYF